MKDLRRVKYPERADKELDCQCCTHCDTGRDLHKSYLVCRHPDVHVDIDKNMWQSLDCDHFKES